MWLECLSRGKIYWLNFQRLNQVVRRLPLQVETINRCSSFILVINRVPATSTKTFLQNHWCCSCSINKTILATSTKSFLQHQQNCSCNVFEFPVTIRRGWRFWTNFNWGKSISYGIGMLSRMFLQQHDYSWSNKVFV